MKWPSTWRTDTGAGRQRGGLGQIVEIGPAEGHELRFNAMFDRIAHPAAGRDGGKAGQPGTVTLDDGTELRGKGSQTLVPPGRRVVLSLPGGGGFGDPAQRDPALLEADLDNGCVSPAKAQADYGAPDRAYQGLLP